MNRRTLNAILIVSVIIIWSIAGYKFLNNKEQKSHAKETPIAIQNTMSKVDQKELFSFTKAKRDPFLDVLFSKYKARSVTSIKNSAKKKTKAPWPNIDFYGFVKNEKNENALVLIKIDGAIKRVRKGTKYDDFTISKIFKDSIVIIKGNESRSFLRQ